MAEKLKHQAPAAAAPTNNVVSLGKCLSDGCSKKGELATGDAGFCKEHYAWFKFGLLTKEGKKPIDFDKKLIAYSKKHAA